jgi:hypothetical protein
MAITPSSLGTPANYSDPSITRYGLINQLNVINVIALNEYYETYGFMPYGAMNQLMGNEEKADNKQFRWYQAHGRALGFVSSSTAVTVSNSSPATITVAAGGYTSSGTKSLPALGMIFWNSRTGVESRVSAVPDKTTANAHTFIITPVVTGQNASTLVGDDLLCRGFKYLGEASDKTATVIRNIDRYSNYCTEIRVDSDITDLGLAEKMEIQINGQYSYYYKQMKDDNLRMMQELDLLLFESSQTSNLPYQEEGSNGVIKQVEANGINGDYTTWNMATFAQIERVLNSVGAARDYDILADNSSYIEMQNSIFTEVNNGAVIYAEPDKGQGIDIDRRFKSLNIYSRKYNFSNFGLFDMRTLYGSTQVGVRDRYSLFVPTGKEQSIDKFNGTTVKKPRFTVMYQTPNGGNKYHTWQTGGMADVPTSPIAEKNTHTIGYFGARLIGAQQYLIMKGGS